MAEKTTQGERRQRARKLAVTNTYRNQPILFHVLGGSVRLGPFETRELNRDCLASPELLQLVRTGVVQVREIDAAAPDVAKGEGTARSQEPAAVPATASTKDSISPGEPESRGSRRK